MSDVKVKGQPIELDGVEYILPPLPLIRLPDVKVLMDGGDVFGNPEYIGTLTRAIHWSLKRNYPDLSIDVVQDSLDMINYSAVIKAFMLTNGFVAPDAASGGVQAPQ